MNQRSRVKHYSGHSKNINIKKFLKKILKSLRNVYPGILFVDKR